MPKRGDRVKGELVITELRQYECLKTADTGHSNKSPPAAVRIWPHRAVAKENGHPSSSKIQLVIPNHLRRHDKPQRPARTVLPA